MKTGKPLGPIIHALDIRFLYSDPSKVEDEPYKSQLPRLSWELSEKNTIKQVPAKFKNYSSSNSKSKSKSKKKYNSNKETKFKRTVSFTETDDGSTADDIDDDELSSATDS